jgi:hypothetical protein
VALGGAESGGLAAVDWLLVATSEPPGADPEGAGRDGVRVGSPLIRTAATVSAGGFHQHLQMRSRKVTASEASEATLGPR